MATSNSNFPSRGNAIFRTLSEAAGVLRAPQRLFPLIYRLASDELHRCFEFRDLYSYTKTVRESDTVLNALMAWILSAQRPDGGIAAYYSLLTGWSASYPEVTGYLVPTLYDFSGRTCDPRAASTAGRATDWLLSLQMPDGSFPGGLHGTESRPSVFNTGQILQGLVRAAAETEHAKVQQAAIAAGEWLVSVQSEDGSWSGEAAYQNAAHSYYSMVAWSLSELAAQSGDRRFALAAEKNLDWVLSYFRASGWVEGISLRGHPNYLHFIAYVLQGALETAIRLKRNDAIEKVDRSAWALLRKFETNKNLCGAYETNFKNGHQFTCLTGNAQMSCVWLRLFEAAGDLRYLNAALKMNELLKQLVPASGRGVAGGVAGSYPIWGRYQPLRYISWGCKFFADALMLEDRMKRSLDRTASEELACAS
ncbi:MAG TPA: prenyltransferase/squalene oxidase repeat-containing protein [Candidatus Binatia bacterium]|nr:prenyltransferase/squalene oxidase repeat-containing protein [Candidatus Binatia bacterium]